MGGEVGGAEKTETRRQVQLAAVRTHAGRHHYGSESEEDFRPLLQLLCQKNLLTIFANYLGIQTMESTMQRS